LYGLIEASLGNNFRFLDCRECLAFASEIAIFVSHKPLNGFCATRLIHSSKDIQPDEYFVSEST
jgi:hypothetical protein